MDALAECLPVQPLSTLRAGRDDDLAVEQARAGEEPGDRVDELVDVGAARRFDAGKGRPMKEWASVPASASRRWKALVEEARLFVG